MWPALTYIRRPVTGSQAAKNSVMNREAGEWRHTWRLSRSASAAASSPSSTSVRNIASSSAISSAAGLPFPATSPMVTTTRPSGSGRTS